jgi:hypothetical protein
MRRILAVSLVMGLVLAPAVAAKGPHAILIPGGAAEPGESWRAKLELYEFAASDPRPVMMATRGERRVAAQVLAAPAKMDEDRYSVRVVFPTAGRWKLTMVSGKRSYSFPVPVGSGVVPKDYVSFPAGSEAARQGAGGVYLNEEPAESGAGGALPPENLSVASADPDHGDGDGDGDAGVTPWLFPLLGVALAGAGVATLRTRRR